MSKPILSELEYNADDVASAILEQADLSVTNQDFAVGDQRSSLELQSGWSNMPSNLPPYLYTFNGFAFIAVSCYHPGGSPSSGEVFLKITNSDFHPVEKIHFPTTGYQGDTGEYVVFQPDGDVEIQNPDNAGASDYYLTINGWYRYS
tara:strand:- start:14 stop:454 length:441 start_codon:yes stop_codon:yes gene_type:complete